MSTLVIGIDPGVTTGLCAVLYDARILAGAPIAVQIHGHPGVAPFVESLLHRSACDDTRPLIAVEKFVIGTRASRSGSLHAGQVTRSLIDELAHLARSEGAQYVTHPAATVKPWATDRRLDAAGLLAATKGMGHARDAARHALYAAVHEGLLADPLRRAMSL